MTKSNQVADHYAIQDITGLVDTGLNKSGISPGEVTINDLSAVDEFHIGGRKASSHFFDQLGFGAEDHLLDIGCGIGGASRFAADRVGSRVTGIDLTKEYVEAGKIMNGWVGMEDRVDLNVGNALSIDYPDKSFDGAFTMHVLMNIEDKLSAFKEVFRVLKPGSVFGVYDVMKYGDGDFAFPVPWAADQSTSFLLSPAGYVDQLESAGFEIEFVNDRHDFAVGFFEAVRSKMAGMDGPPPLGIHILMGKNAPVKIKNMIENLSGGLISPFEIGVRKPESTETDES